MTQKATTPMVSVSMITYNHEQYVKQAIDGILMQEVNFPIEVIIGDDCSQDRTRELILEYQKRHPDIIQTIFHQEKPTGVPGKINFVSTIHAARGKYVAMLDGDDYWTDPGKLQKQVDFLEANPDYALCFHNSLLKFEGVSGQDRDFNPWKEQMTFTIRDFILREWFLHSGSIMYRREWLQQVPDCFYPMQSGDLPLGILLADQGPVGYLPDVMSVYRKNPQGLSNTHFAHRSAGMYQSRMDIFRALDEELNHRHHDLFERAIARFYLEIAKRYLKAGEQEHFRKALKQPLTLKKFYSSSQKLTLLGLRIVNFLPFNHGIIERLITLRLKIKRILTA